MESGVYRTDDLALATSLALEGHTYRIVRLNEKKAVWDFTCLEGKSEDFERVIGDFWDSRHLVEPRAFTSRWARMRKELFSLIPRTVHPDASAVSG